MEGTTVPEDTGLSPAAARNKEKHTIPYTGMKSGSCGMRQRMMDSPPATKPFSSCSFLQACGDAISPALHSAHRLEKNRILVEQQKTSVPVEIPLSAVVGNAIYDYLAEERPDTGEPAPVPVRNTSLFTPGCREHWQHRGKSLQAGGDKAGARRQEGHPYLPAQPGVLHAGERRPTARHHADPGTYSPGFP